MTKAEFEQRFTRTHTEHIALQCFKCGNIDEYPSNFADGQRCKKCGGGCTPIGYLKSKPPGEGRRKAVPHEASEQEALFRWAAFVRGRFPEIDLLYHIPNGGSRNRIEAANLKRQGVKAGVPDLCLPVARGNFHGLYIEMKYGKNKTSEKQNEWLSALEKQGYAAAVCYGWQEAQELITKYLELGGKSNGTRT